MRQQSMDIIEGILYGVDIDFKGDRTLARFGHNAKNVQQHIVKVSEVIAKDVADGKKAGPFDSPPFPHFAVSPIGAVPKKGSDAIRVTHNLSHPFKGTTSVNAGIRDETFQLDTVSTACQAIRLTGSGCLLIKLDVEAAYKQVPVRQEDWPLLGFMWKGKYYYERTLPFGLKSSCRLWDMYASALHHFFQHMGVPIVIHYIDDFLFVIQSDLDLAHDLLDQCLKLCIHLGVPMASRKTEGPTTKLTFLGIQLDTVEMQASLPQDKLIELKRLTTDWCVMKQASTNECESIVGKLSFAASVVRPGRFYLRRLWNHIAKCKRICKHPDARLQLTEDALDDLRWWSEFIQQWNGVSIMLEEEWIAADKIELFMDACTTGYGAVWGTSWFAGRWTEHHLAVAFRRKRDSMPFLELLALTFTAATWGHSWKGKKVVFRSDCMPVCQAITNRMSRNPSSMHLLRHLSSLACLHQFDFRCDHIPGTKNKLADILSRSGDCPQFRIAHPSAQLHMTRVVAVPLPQHQ